jgi:hypothetical protein
MRYHLIKNISEYSSAPQFPTQKDLVERINKQTRFTKKLVNLLILQTDPISNYQKRR